MKPALVTRPEWGSKQTNVPQAPGAKPEVFIHHVAGRTPTSLADERAHMRELQAYAINHKHYVDMDYNVLVGPSGTPYEGRGYFGRSAATLDRNAVSRAICLMGNTDVREPTRGQLETLPGLIVDMIHAGSLRSDVVIYPHRDNPAHPNATICPGRFMLPHMPAVRTEVARLLAPTPPEDPVANPTKYLRVFVPNDPTRAETLVVMMVQGFTTTAERDYVAGFHDAPAKPVTVAQYDALLAVYQA